jgi:methionyl-tRNA formyltransferase
MTRPDVAGLRVVFAGTPEFAAAALEGLCAAGSTIPWVLTQPDRPAGRGMKLQASSVKQFALTRQLPLLQPQGLRLDGKFAQDAAQAHGLLSACRADVMVVAAYGLILPQWVLNSFPLGCLNIHASLLPRWRGAAPIHRAIEAGDSETGVTIMQMDAGLDTGDMLLAQALPITPDDTTGSLHDRLAALGAKLVVQALSQAASNALKPQAQPEAGITYAHKINKQETQLDWRLKASDLALKVRAFNPLPGASAVFAGEPLKIWAAQALSQEPAAGLPAVPGTVLGYSEQGVVVQCGQGMLCLHTLQRAGARRLAAPEFLRGFAMQPGLRGELV